MKEIIYYQTLENKVPYLEWYHSLDKSLKLIVDKRLSKVEQGLYGNNKRLSEKLYELKFDNGLRIYLCTLLSQCLLTRVLYIRYRNSLKVSCARILG